MADDPVKDQIKSAVNDAFDEAARGAYAGALRIQAITLRSQADLLISQAESLDRQAGDVLAGNVEIPSPANRLRLVIEEEQAEAEDEPTTRPGVLLALRRADGTGAADRGDLEVDPSVAAVADEATIQATERWLDLFDDRLLNSSSFVQATLEAAERELPADENTARMVAARTQELDEHARAVEG